MTSRRALWILIAAGTVARLVAFLLRPSLHPDEIFQYLEPAWQRLHGYGWPAWEWAVGLRSWVLPGYHGAWMAILEGLGVSDPAKLHAFLQLHWAAVTLLTIPVAFRAGGFFAALLCALWPELLYFAPHTLTEVPSAVFACWGIGAWMAARTGDDPRPMLKAGGLLSLAVCIRLPNAPIAVVPFVDLLVRRRWSSLGALASAALVPLSIFGLIDQLVWGRPFHSLLAFLDYNFVQGRAAEHGTSPANEYLSILAWRTSFTIVILLAAALVAIRRSWPALAPALLLVLALSTQAHKEERFLLAAWPLLALAWGIAVEQRLVLGSVGSALLLAGTAWGVERMPILDYTGRAGLYDAQTWVGKQPDSTGLLVEGRFHLSGGFFRLGKNVPLETFHPALLANPIFSHAAVRDGSAEEQWCKRAGLERVWGERGFSVYKKR